MKELINTEKTAIGKRIRRLRELLSLTQGQLAKSVGISKGTLRSMEIGGGFTGDYILAISHFFGMELSELTNYKATLPDEIEFRKRIAKYHEENNSTAALILNEAPNLNALIEFRLSKTNFLLMRPRSVKEITVFCKNEYNLTFKSSVVSQGLINAVKDGVLKRIHKGNKNYLYQSIREREPNLK